VLYNDTTFGAGFHLSTPGINQLALDVPGGEKIAVGKSDGCGLGLVCDQCKKSQAHAHSHQQEASFFHHGNLLFSSVINEPISVPFLHCKVFNAIKH
jgi:hypothetical protein